MFKLMKENDKTTISYACPPFCLLGRRKPRAMSYLMQLVLMVVAATVILGSSLAFTAEPVLFFSDLTSGPNTGGQDNKGAFVTIWGKSFGSTRGSSYVSIGGGEADSYPIWTDTKITFQLGPNAVTGEIIVAIEAGISNSLPFSIREGNIYFVKTTGDDTTGEGSWSNPWKTIVYAKDNVFPGDIIYICDGVSKIDEEPGFTYPTSTCLSLVAEGTPENPLALVAYPGATVNIGDDSIGIGINHGKSGVSSKGKYWVISQINIRAKTTAITAFEGVRIAGNKITAPNGDGPTGGIEGRKNHIKILGNEIYDVGKPDGSKLYHVIYLSGLRKSTSPRYPTEYDREIAWNYFHDCNGNRAINIYSEQDYSAFIEGHNVHDNLIVNQRGDGILFGYYITGENWIYNNVIVNAGWGVGVGSNTGIRIGAGHEDSPNTVIHCYNNTIYGCGDSNGGGGSGHIMIDQAALGRATVHFKNNIIYSTAEPYEADWSGTPPSGDYYNLWYGNGTPPSWDTAALNLDPLFVDLANHDFYLQEASPAIDTGSPDVGLVVTTGYDGISRPQGSAYDIGVYEYVSESILKGDLTGDDLVNIQDIQACVNHILGTQDWGDVADVNDDDAVNVLDVQEIVNLILSL